MREHEESFLSCVTMPEIMNAEELFCEIEQKININGGYDAYEIENTIRSRDSAMLEKYKEAMEKLDFHEAGYYDVCRALDSAFAEINNK